MSNATAVVLKKLVEGVYPSQAEREVIDKTFLADWPCLRPGEQLRPVVEELDERICLRSPHGCSVLTCPVTDSSRFCAGHRQKLAELAADIVNASRKHACQLGIEERLVDVTFETLPANTKLAGVTKAIGAVREYLDDGYHRVGRCLIIGGRTGCGKTLAAVAALRHVYPAPRRTRDLESTAPKLVRFRAFCRDVMNFENLNARDRAWNSVTSRRLVVLDDVGGEYVKADGQLASRIEELIDEREAAVAPTIITTNLSLDKLCERLGDRAASRLKGSWGMWRNVDGPDLR